MNGSNDSKNTPAVFSKAGNYALSVTVADASGGTVSGTTNVTVAQVLTSIAVTPPGGGLVATSNTSQFTATGFDQFGDPMVAPPSFAWSGTGGGTINSSGFLTTGTQTGGPYTAVASALGVSGTGLFRVLRTPPSVTITSPGTWSVIVPNMANSLVLTATASSPYAAPSLTWKKLSGPTGGVASFSNTNQAVSSVTFSQSGTYTLCCIANDTVLTATNNLVVGVGVPALNPYVDADLGATGTTGSCTMTGGTFALLGSGADIYGTSDAFHYAYAQTSGSVVLTARVAGIQSPGASSVKAGLMIRQSLDPGSANVSLLILQNSSSVLEYRDIAGNVTVVPTHLTFTPPYWVRLVRIGGSVTGYFSPDGVNWSPAGTTPPIALSDPVNVGLAVSSRLKGTLASGTFDNVNGMFDSNSAPQVDPGATVGVATHVAASLNGSASDDGLPLGSSLTTAWSMVSGSGTANFGNANALASTVTPSAFGNYVLRLSASDGSATVFQNIGLTSYTPPSISVIANQSMLSNTSVGPLSFTVSNAVIPSGSPLVAGSLTLAASSSNLGLVPNANVILGGGTSASRTATITPALNKGGLATITLTVSSGTLASTNSSFSLNVTPTFTTWVSAMPALGTLTKPLDDPNHDGIPNLLSYALGVDPLASCPSVLPVIGRQNGYLTLTYRQCKSVTGVSFSVEGVGKINGGLWSTTGIAETSRVDMGTYWLVTASDGVPIFSGSSRFLHLKVSQP